MATLRNFAPFAKRRMRESCGPYAIFRSLARGSGEAHSSSARDEAGIVTAAAERRVRGQLRCVFPFTQVGDDRADPDGMRAQRAESM
jgi:hypothetical protein